MNDEILVCPSCQSDKVLVYEKRAIWINTYDHFCHSVKASDDDAEVRCSECDWKGVRKDLSV